MKPGTSATIPQPDAGKLVSARELSKLSGVSTATISNLSRSKMIPRPVGQDKSGVALYDLADPELAAWVQALQAAGYDRR